MPAVYLKGMATQEKLKLSKRIIYFQRQQYVTLLPRYPRSYLTKRDSISQSEPEILQIHHAIRLYNSERYIRLQRRDFE